MYPEPLGSRSLVPAAPAGSGQGAAEQSCPVVDQSLASLIYPVYFLPTTASMANAALHGENHARVPHCRQKWFQENLEK